MGQTCAKVRKPISKSKTERGGIDEDPKKKTYSKFGSQSRNFDQQPVPSNNNHKQPKVSAVSYKKGMLLNESAYSSIYETLNMNTGELLAIKTFTPNEAKDKIKMLDYISKKIIGKKHVNILEYFDVIENDAENEICVISELIPGYSVEALIEKFGKFDENVSRIFMKQALEGLLYLHNNKTAHGNLKSSNILIDNMGVAKLCDFFYVSKSMLKPHNEKEAKATPKIWCYSSPEVFLEQKRHYENDIWALGCILVEMLTGEKPWGKHHLNQNYIKDQMTQRLLPPLPPRISTLCKDFLTNIFKYDKEQRLNAKQLLESEFMKAISDIENDDGLIFISGVNIAGLKSVSVSKRQANLGKSMLLSALPPNLRGNAGIKDSIALGTSFNFQGFKQLKTIREDPAKQELAKLKTFMINDGIKRQGTFAAENFKPRNEDESKKINDYLEMNRKKFEEDLLKQLQFFEDEDENGQNGYAVEEEEYEEGVVD
jgi:serine/threonine protein kinase